MSGVHLHEVLEPGKSGRKKWSLGKGHAGTFWGDGNKNILNRGVGYIGVCICLKLFSKSTINICASHCMEVLQQKKNTEL